MGKVYIRAPSWGLSVATWLTKTLGMDFRVRAYLSQILWRSQGKLKMMSAKLALKISVCLVLPRGLHFQFPDVMNDPLTRLGVCTLIIRGLEVGRGR